MDLNNDGYADVLYGSYSNYDANGGDGYFQVLFGNEKGEFANPRVVKGADNKFLSNVPGLSVDVDFEIAAEIVGTAPRAADLNEDGKLDIVSGNRKGSFFFFEGLGDGKFSEQPMQLKSGGKPLMVDGHSDPVFVDWDHDGDLDMLSGANSGGVFLSINQGTKNKFEFSKFKTLIAPPKAGSDIQFGNTHINGPVYATRVCVEDINGDGKLDLIVGDKLTIRTPGKGLTESEAKKKYELITAKLQKLSEDIDPKIDALFEKMDALELKTDQDGEFKNKDDLTEYNRLYDEFEKLNAKTDPLDNELKSVIRQESTGSVWVYLQK